MDHESEIWYRVIDLSEVPRKLGLAGDKMLAFVKADLRLPGLKLAWCLQDTADNERADTEWHFKVHRETGMYEPTPYRTEEAFQFPTLTSLYILADKPVEYSVRHIAFRAKIFQIFHTSLWSKIGHLSRGDPAADPYAYAEHAAVLYAIRAKHSSAPDQKAE